MTPHDGTPQHAPSVSVVVPTYDRPGELAECLAALATSDLPRDEFEVVVVDDGSPVDAREIVAGFGDRLHVRALRQANSGPAVARNVGARLARGRLLAFTDDDCRPTAAWLSSLLRSADGSGDACVGGHTRNSEVGNPFSAASQELVDFLYSYYSPQEHAFFTTNNLCVRREAFLDVGGFDESFPTAAAEDRDFCDRWKLSGRPLRFAPDAVVLHAHRMGPVSFFRQHFGYGQGALRFHRLREDRGADRMRVEPLAFYAGLLRHPFRGNGPLRASMLSALIAVAQFANASGYFHEKLFGGRRDASRERRLRVGSSVSRADAASD